METSQRPVTVYTQRNMYKSYTTRPLSPVKAKYVKPRLSLTKKDYWQPIPRWRCDSVEYDSIVVGFGATPRFAYASWKSACRVKRLAEYQGLARRVSQLKQGKQCFSLKMTST